jgi:hypothetical protein
MKTVGWVMIGAEIRIDPFHHQTAGKKGLYTFSNLNLVLTCRWKYPPIESLDIKPS